MNSLFLKKLILAFVLGAVPFLLTGLLGIAVNVAENNHDGLDLTVLGTAVISLIAGAVATGLRAAIAYWTDWFPTDVLHGSGDHPATVTVARNS